MVPGNLIRNFYSSFSFPDFSVFDLEHRHIRCEIAGQFVKSAHRHDKESLKLYVQQHAPSHVYYSVSRWLNPHLLVPKEKSVSITDNLFLGCDLVFDIDVAPFSFENIEQARLHTVRLYKRLKQEYSLRYIAFSGSKGFHLVFDDPVSYVSSHPLEKEQEAKEFRQKLVERLEDYVFDSKVTVDTRRIIRLPHTINSKTGYLCRRLTEQELYSSAKEILKNTPRITVSAFETARASLAHVWDDCCGFARKRGTTLCAAFSKADPAHIPFSVSTSCLSFQSYLSSSLLGARNRHVPIISLPNTTRMRKRLCDIQKEFGLGTLYVFLHDSTLYALSCDALQTEYVEKILTFSKSSSLLSFRKYAQGFLPLFDKKGDLIRFETTYPGVSKHSQSKGHVRFLHQTCGINKRDNSVFCGNDEYKIVDAIIES